MSKARNISNLFSGSTDAATDAEVVSAIANHASASDPHADRAYTDISAQDLKILQAIGAF